MKILRKKDQDTAELLIIQTMKKILQGGDVERLDAIEELTLLAYVTGGIQSMHRIGKVFEEISEDEEWISNMN